MNQWIKIACRNIFRNRRRSFVTLLAIAIGFSAISLFRGYTDNTFEGLRNSAIRGEGLGHLTIFKQGWTAHGKMNPDAYLFTPEAIKTILETVETETEVILATPELHISGLVTNGSLSTIFLAKGVVPEDEKTIKGGWGALRPLTGETLTSDKPYGVEMAQDLADNLSLKQGSESVILSSTLDGQMNALNIEISGIYNTGNSATNDKYMKIPLSYAQELYDTRKADRIIVLLDHWKHTGALKNRLIEKLTKAGVDTEIKTWNELSTFYTQVKGMFNMIFTFIFSIVLVIVVMSVINTMGMAVLERTREIGTLRALGLKRRSVSLLFALEGAMLGLSGCILGSIITVVAWAVITWIEPTYVPPSSSAPVPLVVNLLPAGMAMLSGFLALLSLTAAILPARRAAGQAVVEALGHV